MGILFKDKNRKDNPLEGLPIKEKLLHTDKSVKDFTSDLGSKQPVPGGGGAASVAGALGAALGSMVAALTIGKEKYADVEDDLIYLKSRAYNLETEFLQLVEKDAAVFLDLSATYKLPKETDEEKETKERMMEAALKEAALVPLDIMRKACETIELMDGFAEKGSKLAVSDAGCGVALCKSALQCAWLNVCINTKAMKDREFAEKVDTEGRELLSKYIQYADEIYKRVEEELR